MNDFNPGQSAVSKAMMPIHLGYNTGIFLIFIILAHILKSLFLQVVSMRNRKSERVVSILSISFRDPFPFFYIPCDDRLPGLKSFLFLLRFHKCVLCTYPLYVTQYLLYKRCIIAGSADIFFGGHNTLFLCTSDRLVSSQEKKKTPHFNGTPNISQVCVCVQEKRPQSKTP